MRKLIILCLFVLTYATLSAQNIIIQQNNNQQAPKEKIIEKKIYVPVEKKEDPKQPICLHGYLYVFPEDLGRFREYPSKMINMLNKSKPYGRGNWRLPTLEELQMMEQNSYKLGYVIYKSQMVDFYMHSYYGNACICDTHILVSPDDNFDYPIRLVSTDY